MTFEKLLRPLVLLSQDEATTRDDMIRAMNIVKEMLEDREFMKTLKSFDHEENI